MELYKVNSCTDDGIDLKSEKQLESLLEQIKESNEVMIRWEEDTSEYNNVPRSKILITDSLMSRIKDGRFTLTSTDIPQEE